jgi:FlaA1/EpsC-like NDP-sugar epimerase
MFPGCSPVDSRRAKPDGGATARGAGRIIVIGANRFASGFIQLLNAYAPQRQPVIAVLDGDRGMVGRAVAGVQVFGAWNSLELAKRPEKFANNI